MQIHHAAENGAGFLTPIAPNPKPALPVIEKPGDRIGRYKLLQQIGEGGCGIVYMAEQEEPLRRRVALKVIKLGMTVVAVESKCWEKTTAEELVANAALTSVRHAPRKLLVLGNNRPDTYVFRTAEGTLGMLQIVGMNEDGQGVKIRYKLINSAKSNSTAA